jgi:hypothetical protein
MHAADLDVAYVSEMTHRCPTHCSIALNLPAAGVVVGRTVVGNNSNPKIFQKYAARNPEPD